MAKQAPRKVRRLVSPTRQAVTRERFSRLYHLVGLLATGPRSRAFLTRKLRIDVRGFYRDLELLRGCGLPIELTDGLYELSGPEQAAVDLLPFPDPLLSLGEARSLARGRTASHRSLQTQIDSVLR